MDETYEKETCGYAKVEWRYERFREMWKYGDMRKWRDKMSGGGQNTENML